MQNMNTNENMTIQKMINNIRIYIKKQTENTKRHNCIALRHWHSSSGIQLVWVTLDHILHHPYVNLNAFYIILVLILYQQLNL